MSQFYNTGVEGQFERHFDIDIETTTRCNAACPMCFRNLSGDRINPDLNIEDFNTDWIDNIDLMIGTVSLCGNYGDPIMVNNLHQVLHDLNKKINWAPDHKIIIMTNGGARTTDWWKELAGIMKTIGATSRVVFGIDGLEDTNHLYRRNVNWNKLMKNVEAYISAGGRATWKMILFKHNQHQVEEAKKLADDMGFAFFDKIATNRFKNVKNDYQWPVLGKQGEHLYSLETSTVDTSKYQPRKLARKAKKVWTGEINCYANRDRSIYLAASGKVYPCPNTGYVYSAGQKRVVKTNETAPDNNLAHTRLSDIINGKFFTAMKKSHGDKDLCIPTCARTCGVKTDNLLKTEMLHSNWK